MPIWENEAANQAGNILGAGMGLLLEKHNDKRQLKQQGKLQALQIQGQEHMADYNYGKQMELWHATNYGAQMEELKKAGLSPALMYDGAGQGGTTAAAQGGGVQGANAPAGGMEIMNMMMQKAQIELMKAQTQKTTAEAANVPLQGKNIQASTENIIANTGNTRADTELKEVETSIKSIEESIKGQTQTAAIATIKQELRANYAQMLMIERNNKLDSAMFDDKIELMQRQVIMAGLNNQEIQKSIDLKGQTIDQIKQQMDIALRQIQNAENQTAIEQQLANFQTSFGGQAAQFLQAVIPMLGIKKPVKK